MSVVIYWRLILRFFSIEFSVGEKAKYDHEPPLQIRIFLSLSLFRNHTCKQSIYDTKYIYLPGCS